MTLSSQLFTKDGPGKDALQKCAQSHAHHLFKGMATSPEKAAAVARVQAALRQLGFKVSDPEGVYGQSTADAVLAFKGPPRNILGPGQTRPDAIVGIQTIHRLDSEIGGSNPSPGPTPPPGPQEEGSTRWHFSFFGHARVLGANEWGLMIVSSEPGVQDGGRFTIVENFFQPTVVGPELLTGFKGTANGTFTTPRKAKASEFGAAAAELRVFKLMFSDVVSGILRLGTVGTAERQMNVTLPIQLRDTTIKSDVTSGAFHMDGQLRAS